MGLAKHYYTDGGLSALRTVAEKRFFATPKEREANKRADEIKENKKLLKKLGII